MPAYSNPWVDALSQYNLMNLPKGGGLDALLSQVPSNSSWVDYLATGGPTALGQNVAGKAGLSPQATGTMATLSIASPEEMAKALGVSVWRIRQAMGKSGKDLKDLTLADLAGIPELPTSIKVGGVDSFPSQKGPSASWTSPTGGSSSWGGLTGAQIQNAFLAAAGGDPALAQQMWEEEHKKEVAQNGF